MGNPVVHVEIGSRDAARPRRFHADLLDREARADTPLGRGIVSTGWKDRGGIDGVGTVARFRDPQGHLVGLYRPDSAHTGPRA